MSTCKICKKLLRERPEEFFNYKGPSGYKVIEKAGKLSYRCSCNRCGHIWLTRSEDAKFQFEEPEKYAARRKQLEKIVRKMDLEKKHGETIVVYKKQYP